MILNVKVKSNKKNSQIVLDNNGELMISVKSAPIDGKANKEVIEILAKHFNTQKNGIKILHGLKSKNKVIQVL